MVHDGIILWAPVVFPPATLMPWCNPKSSPRQQKGPKHSHFSHFMPGFCCTRWLGWNPSPSENRFAGKNGCCCGTTTFWIYDHSCQSNVCNAPRPSFFKMKICMNLQWTWDWLFYASFGFFWCGDFLGFCFLLVVLCVHLGTGKL